MTPFLQLEDFLLPAPLPACIAVLMCLGLKHLGDFLVCILRRSSPYPMESAAGFILVTGLVAFLTNLMAIFGYAHVWPLRIIAWGLAGCGVIELFKLRKGCLTDIFLRLQAAFQKQSPWGKIGIMLICITGVCLCLASLGPPTDADSLDYHLGLPLDILRNHQAYPRPDWMSSRLAGLGESLNMLGLAGGTDIFGASLQFSGLLVALITVMSLVRTDFDRILAAMIVIGCPLLLFLIPNQKPQMLPTAGTTIALIMIVRRFQSIDSVTIVLAFGSVFFAMSCKYSFLLSGTIVIGTGMIAAYQNRQFGTAILAVLAGSLIFLFPLYLQKFLFYGDPITPLLERFFHGDLAVLQFAKLLKDFKDSSMVFPLCLIFPDSLGTISMTLGLGTLLIFAVPSVRGPARILIICALLSATLTILMGQVTSRFFLEPYIWIAAAVVAANTWRVKPIFFKLMVGQMMGVAAMAAFAAVILFPGALTDSLRQEVMHNYAFGYSEAKWLDSCLPKSAVVLTGLRFKALMPRPFMSSEIIYYSLEGKDEVELGKVSLILKRYGIDTCVTNVPLANLYLGSLFPIPVGEPKTFRIGVRNPWNTSSYQIMIYRPTPHLP